MRRGFLLVLVGFAAIAQIDDIAGQRIRAHVKFLASDLLEGRGVGTRGEKLATEYIAAQFALLGAKPAGDNGTYFQNLTLVGVDPRPDTELTATGKDGKSIVFRWLDDFVGVTGRQNADVDFDAPAIFVGHGISAPEYQWDDYKGVDVRGKVVVMFTNEPPSEDPHFFTGASLTYYGRWTYKFEQAARKGAVAVIIIHTTPTASYGWDVVRSSWGREDQQVKAALPANELAFEGWVTKEAGEKIAASAGKSVDELLHMADRRGFVAIPLPLRFHGRAPAKIREIQTRNVVAIIEGSDARMKDEAVVFSAHWDHLGIGDSVNGDAIYNGAADNATGCGLLLEIARAWAQLPEKPRRSAIFLAATAEEAGLRGSEYYGQHPLIPAGKTAVAVNFDMYLPVGRARDVTVSGAERTTIYPLVENAANRLGLIIQPDPHPDAGSYYRSDHFSFARAGIPSFSIKGGEDLLGKPAGTGAKLFAEYNANRYHQPSDEYREDWDFSGMEQYARMGFLIGLNVANMPSLPTWRTGDEFLPARIASGVK